jgi:hypothetical protein
VADRTVPDIVLREHLGETGHRTGQPPRRPGHHRDHGLVERE